MDFESAILASQRLINNLNCKSKSLWFCSAYSRNTIPFNCLSRGRRRQFVSLPKQLLPLPSMAGGSNTRLPLLTGDKFPACSVRHISPDLGWGRFPPAWELYKERTFLQLFPPVRVKFKPQCCLERSLGTIPAQCEVRGRSGAEISRMVLAASFLCPEWQLSEQRPLWARNGL